jgi:hypothetical protein
VRDDPGRDIFPKASCGTTTHQIDGNDDTNGAFWWVPVNKCKNGKIFGKNGKIVEELETEKMPATQHPYVGIGVN